MTVQNTLLLIAVVSFLVYLTIQGSRQTWTPMLPSIIRPDGSQTRKEGFRAMKK
jgi:hypothetical protein